MLLQEINHAVDPLVPVAIDHVEGTKLEAIKGKVGHPWGNLGVQPNSRIPVGVPWWVSLRRSRALLSRSNNSNHSNRARLINNNSVRLSNNSNHRPINNSNHRLSNNSNHRSINNTNDRSINNNRKPKMQPSPGNIGRLEGQSLKEQQLVVAQCAGNACFRTLYARGSPPVLFRNRVPLANRSC